MTQAVSTDTRTDTRTDTKTAALPSDAVTPESPSAAPPVANGSRENAFEFPPSIELGFNLVDVRDGQPRQGSGSLVWKSDGKTYEMRLAATVLFINLLTQISTGRVGEQGIEPERFSDKRINRSEQAAHFERDKAVISFSSNRPPAALQRGAQDRTSVSMQLAALLAGAPQRYEKGSNISVQVVSTNDASVWVFNVEGTETVSVPAGTAQAVHLTRSPRSEFDPRLELWFAPQLNYLPIRIKQTESNGNTFDLLLRSPALRPVVGN